MRSANPSYRNVRHAITLVELMIVMGILILLATITLPSVKGLLSGQKISQAARVVQGMAEAARAKAVASGRPSALIIERIPVDASAPSTFSDISDNSGYRLSIGEVFPPYEGDWSGTTGILSETIGSDGFPDTLTIDFAKVASLYDTSTSALTGLALPGDLIQLADHSQIFKITGLAPKAINNVPMFQVTFSNPPVDFLSQTASRASEPLWSTNGEVRFRMYRRPTKSLTASATMPRGTCIDLSVSGIGATGIDFATTRPSGAAADYYGPLYVIFNARGGIDGAYTRVGGATATPTDMGATGVFHFLVGRTNQVQVGAAAAVSDRDDFKPNIADTGNVWVSLNPYSGAIYSSDNGAVSALTNIAEARVLAIQALSRNGN